MDHSLVHLFCAPERNGTIALKPSQYFVGEKSPRSVCFKCWKFLRLLGFSIQILLDPCTNVCTQKGHAASATLSHSVLPWTQKVGSSSPELKAFKGSFWKALSRSQSSFECFTNVQEFWLSKVCLSNSFDFFLSWILCECRVMWGVNCGSDFYMCLDELCFVMI